MRVLTIGSAMVDTIAIIDSGRIERMTMLNADSSFLLLEEGRKTEAVEVSTHSGGGAVNVAVAMARLGMDVALLAKVGVDARAETILQRLEKEGVSTVWVKRDPRLPTGSSVLIASHVIRAVELIYADHTPQSLVAWGREFLKTIDHVGVACRERPGFLVNRIQYALLSEVYRIMDEGVASRDDVDAAVRLSLGPRTRSLGSIVDGGSCCKQKNRRCGG